jgi:hypothetical protein
MVTSYKHVWTKLYTFFYYCCVNGTKMFVSRFFPSFSEHIRCKLSNEYISKIVEIKIAQNMLTKAWDIVNTCHFQITTSGNVGI